MNSDTMTSSQKAAATRAANQLQWNVWVTKTDMADIGAKLSHAHQVATRYESPASWRAEARAHTNYIRRALDHQGIREAEVVTAYEERRDYQRKLADQRKVSQVLVILAMNKDPVATIAALEKLAA